MFENVSRRQFVTGTAATLMGLGLVGCGGNGGGESAEGGDASGAIKVGIMGPHTGDNSSYGLACLNGAQLYFKQLNADGGVNGKQVEPVVYDEKGDATEAVNAYNRLVQEDGVTGIVGDVTTGPTIAVAKASVADNMPCVTPSATAADVVTYGDNYFRACVTDPEQGRVMANFAVEQGYKSVATLYLNGSDYSEGVNAAFCEEAEAAGITITAQESYAEGDVDFNSQLTNIIDVVSLQKSLAVVVANHGDVIREIYGAAMEASNSTDMLGFLTGTRDIAITYVNLVPNITLTFGISALPVITSAWALKDKKQLRSMVSTVLRITLLVALPAGVGLSVLAQPIINMIYNSASAAVAGPQLAVLGWATIFICLVGPINAMLQAMGRADIPAKIVLVGGAVKLLLNTTLVMTPRINIMGSAYSTLACYIVMVLLSLAALRHVMHMRLQWRMIFVKPLLAAVLCGAAAWASNGLLGLVMSKRIATALAICVAAIIYVFALFLLKAIRREEILMLPKGQKIAQTLEKHGWIG